MCVHVCVCVYVYVRACHKITIQVTLALGEEDWALLKISHQLKKINLSIDGWFGREVQSQLVFGNLERYERASKGSQCTETLLLSLSVCASSWTRWSALRSKGISGRSTTFGQSTAEEDSALWTTFRRFAPSATRPYVHTLHIAAPVTTAAPAFRAKGLKGQKQFV